MNVPHNSKRKIVQLAVLFSVALASVAATQRPAAEEPVANTKPQNELLILTLTDDAPQQFPVLHDAADADMQQALVLALEGLQLSAAVQRGELGVALVDITDLNHPRMAGVNEDIMIYAASLPKIAILLGAFQRVEDGEMSLDNQTVAQLTRMIRYSSNADATAMLNRVGKDYLADLLQSDRYRLYDPDFGGGLWVGKEYARSGAWKRDPINNISHGATAYEVARFYYLLETGRLVSEDSCRRMKEILSRPAIAHKFVRGLQQNRPGSTIYRKSGSWKQFHSDSAIVERDGKRYIAVALASNPNGGEWLSRLIVSLDDIIFDRAHSKS